MSLGYYGQKDRQLLQEIANDTESMVRQMGALLSIENRILDIQKKILEALQSQQVRKPAVSLKFSLGHVVDK